ncbi:o-methyltransferase [Diplodia corticola]|uniref:O-methyltransferase n=1 Tax=Diplodia corticola TaxID=236234 RepID=A0A1J9RMS7_9PEZI|nr:o-methyltransferase [Diplodia corticola]OJD29220.1 o-methyltransferase [Diplodia corticola]
MSESLKALSNHLSKEIGDYSDSSGPDGFAQRKRIIALAREIIDDVQDPREKPFDDYCVWMAEMGALRLLMDWRALEHIPSDGCISYADLAAKVNAEEPLLRRFAWVLVSTGVLRQIGDDCVAHTKFSPIYANDVPQGKFFQIMFDEGLVPYSKFPEYFRKYGRKEPLEPTHSPHGFGWGVPEKNFWDACTAERIAAVNISMQTLDQKLPVVGIYPFEWIVENADKVSPDAPLVVDVGGGKGQVLAQIKGKLPELPSERLVLQDREPTIKEAEESRPPQLKGARFMVHDFFQPQPVKGALVYFLRRIMHDWSDKYNAQILGHCKDAMTPHSRIIIMDQVMPNPPTTLPSQTDICMMNLGAKERTIKDWHTLIDLAGLDLVKIWQIPSSEVSVIECKKRAEA